MLGKMRLIILGALPPPRGGVTTHIERLIPYLKEAGIKFVIWDHSKIRKKKEYVISLRWEPVKVLFSLMQPGVKVLHCPLSNITVSKLMFLFIMKLFGIRLTITLVASPEHTIGNNSLDFFFVLALARFSSHIVAVNGDFQRLLVDNGIPENKLSTIPAFIPANELTLKEESLHPDVVDFYIKRKPLIITYAHGPDLHKGDDLYGLDIIVQLAQELRADFPQTGFLLVIPEITNRNYLRNLRVNIRASGLDSFFCFAIGNQFSFVHLLQYVDLFIRATKTDGDALTLREALYYGIPSVASDVCYRPEGTILFRSRDISDLCRAVREVLNNNGTTQYSTEAQQINNAELFIDVFKRAADLRD